MEARYQVKTFKIFGKALCGLAMLLMGATATWGQGAAPRPTSPQTLTFAVSTFGGEVFDPVVAKAELINILAVMYDSLVDPALMALMPDDIGAK